MSVIATLLGLFHVGCRVQCLNGGVCRNDKCECPEGFEGQFCENRTCIKNINSKMYFESLFIQFVDY